MRATDTPDKKEIEFLMKFFDLDEITVRNAHERAHNHISRVMKILMKKSEEKNK